jgi:hypothetical protein
MEKRMAVTQDSPLYGMACNLNDIEYRLTNEFSCQPHTVGGELIASVIGLREQVDEINNALTDVMPHLADIIDSYHADEQRDYEEETETNGEKPTSHIFLSIDKMADFFHWIEDLSDV